MIRGNYMHDMPEVPFIMAADGADHELIEDNVVEGSSRRLSVHHPVLRRLLDRPPQHLRRRRLRLQHPLRGPAPGAKDSDDPGHGTVVKDNILGEISIEGSTTVASRSHNLLANDNPSGPGEIRGQPTYVGGANPQSYAGYRLKPGLARLATRRATASNRGARSRPPSGAVPAAECQLDRLEPCAEAVFGECGWRESNPHVLSDTAT